MKFKKESLSDEKGITEADVDPKQLAMGIEVEYEHTDSPEEAKKIALDHLAEIPDYYSRLKKMEDEAKSMKKELYAEVEKMESEIKKGENPIQANPDQPRNPNYDLEGADNVPDDKKPDELMVEIEALERQLEAAKPYQAPIRKPQKSDVMESPDGKAIMDEIDKLGKAVDALAGQGQGGPANEWQPGIEPEQQVPNPAVGGMEGDTDELEECDGKGPMKKEADGAEPEVKPEIDKPKVGSPVKIPIPKPTKPVDPTESLSVKEYLNKSKELKHQIKG